jgi:hypothetical protein
MESARLFAVRVNLGRPRRWALQFNVEARSAVEAWQLAMRRWRYLGEPQVWEIEDLRPSG